MIFRRAEKADVNAILQIIEQAKLYFKAQQINQWQNGYPNRAIILEDISAGYSYVLEDQEHILGTLALIFDKEPTYENIEKGQWKTNEEPYAVIHRIAVDSSFKGQGIAGLMIQEVEDICRGQLIRSIKNDTHENNLSMKRMLEKNEFTHCGVIYLEDGDKRIAFEKLLF